MLPRRSHTRDLGLTAPKSRTAEAARDSGQGKALRLAFNGGAVMGLAVASLGLVGIGLVIMGPLLLIWL